jgi:transcriptional regulator with XRE-family HTH domain
MAKRSPDALIRPALLIWAREDAGLELATVAKKVGTSVARVESWESGERLPTIIQLRKLANLYKRPLAVFYLAEPPTRFQAMRDFRRLPTDLHEEESFALRLAIRHARYTRDVALELYRHLTEAPPNSPNWNATVDEDPEDIAQRIRADLGVAFDEQERWNKTYEAMNEWRARIERRGILVLQMSGVEVEEARAFSIFENELPVITINNRDAPAGRVLSMHHELAHIALRTGGLCDLHSVARTSGLDIEVFCNHVGGAIVVSPDVVYEQ